MKIEKGPICFHKDETDKEQLLIEGTNFFGSINDRCDLIGGYLEKETVNSDGSFFFLFKWYIKCDGRKIDCIVKVAYTYTNQMILPGFEDLLDAANLAVVDATNFFNNEMRNKGIDIVARNIKILDVDDKRNLYKIEEVCCR